MNGGAPAGGPTNEEVVARTLPLRPFEMPDGWNGTFGIERLRVAEGLWDASAALPAPSESPPADGDIFSAPPRPQDTIPALIQASLAAVDVDIRNQLLGCVIVTGGSSLLFGFTERLNAELQGMFPSAKVKLHAAGNTAERRYGAWIGGSILGSLGTFHQLWISSREYEEHGAGIVERRCK